MRTTSFFAALIASTALAACGGGEQESADAGDTTDEAMQASAEQADTGETMTEDMGSDADEPMAEPQEEPMDADETQAEGDMAEGDAGMSDDGGMEGDAAASGDAEFMVAGLTGDPEAGRRVFARCRSCHVIEEGVNRVGPSLYGVFGRETGSVEGFRYSDANASAEITWTHETMFEYLENPREYIPGTIMAFPGLRDEQDRADVIAYISANGGEG